MSVLFPYLSHISRSQGIRRLSIEFRFQPNTAAAITIARFVKSSTANNPYTSSVISFSNIQLRLAYTRHSDALLLSVPNPIIFVPKYDTRTFVPNATTQRIQLQTDFSHHSLCHGILVYFWDTALITAYNDADSCKVYSGVAKLGFEVKYKSRSIVKLDTAGETNKRAKYHHDVHFKRYGKIMNSDLVSEATTVANLYVPLTFIDLQSVALQDNDIEDIYSGVNNESVGLELIVSSMSGAVFTATTQLYVVLCYYEVMVLDAKTGILKLIRK
jgi:hypothetical protein